VFESDSGQMVSEKVKFTYFDVYLSQTMHVESYKKINERAQTANFRVMQGDVRSSSLKTKENKENKHMYYSKFKTGMT